MRVGQQLGHPSVGPQNGVASGSSGRAFAYPIALALDGRPCLVVGGGARAERTVQGLLRAGARVTVVSPGLSHEMLALAADGHFAWRPREYAAGDAHGVLLALVATGDRAVDGAVADDARRAGALVHCADDPGLSDFVVPPVDRAGAAPMPSA